MIDLAACRSKAYRVALHYRVSPSNADDIAQKVTLAAWQQKALTCPEGFVSQAAKNLVIELSRKAHRAKALAPFPPPPAPSSEDVALNSELGRTLTAAFVALPKVQQEVFWLKDVEGLSHEEIAETLGITVLCARKRLFKARAAMRAELGYT